MWRIIIALIMFVSASLVVPAQCISRQYVDVPFSAALKDLNNAQDKYVINFVYDELEDFRVTKTIRNLSVPEAVKQLIGFYPIKMTLLDNVIIVECIHKASAKMIGRVVDSERRHVDFANVVLLDVRDSCFITGGVTNENGQFVIPCEARKAIVKVSCVGYTPYSRLYTAGDIGTITLNEATMQLREIVVERHHDIYKANGTNLVVDVRNSVLSDFGSADDVIAQLPMVSGSDGDYTVFGRGNAEVYINNRRYVTEVN